MPARRTLRVKFHLGDSATAFTDEILEGWNGRPVMRSCVQSIPSFMTKRMIGITLPRTKHTVFHVPRQECNSGHGAHNFAQNAEFLMHPVTTYSSLFHHGEPQIGLCLFYCLGFAVMMCGLLDVLGVYTICDLLTSLFLPDID